MMNDEKNSLILVFHSFINYIITKISWSSPPCEIWARLPWGYWEPWFYVQISGSKYFIIIQFYLIKIRQAFSLESINFILFFILYPILLQLLIIISINIIITRDITNPAVTVLIIVDYLAIHHYLKILWSYSTLLIIRQAFLFNRIIIH